MKCVTIIWGCVHGMVYLLTFCRKLLCFPRHMDMWYFDITYNNVVLCHSITTKLLCFLTILLSENGSLKQRLLIFVCTAYFVYYQHHFIYHQRLEERYKYKMHVVLKYGGRNVGPPWKGSWNTKVPIVWNHEYIYQKCYRKLKAAWDQKD